MTDRETATAMAREKRARWKRDGLCNQCGGERDVPDRAACKTCNDKAQARNKPRHQTNAQKRKVKVQGWKRDGLCTGCGGPRDNPPRLTCVTCKGKRKRVDAGRYRERRDAGLCGVCGLVESKKASCQDCLDRHRPTPERQAEYDARGREARKADRQRALDAYGSICQCCGESEPLFLQIDHVENDGNVHRKTIGNKGIVQWLRENDYPSGFQVLCVNCNWGKHLNGGVCPHVSGEAA